MHPYLEFRDPLHILRYRNEHRKLGCLSVRADMLKERNKGSGVDFTYLMAADFVLYLRSRNRDVWQMWWPETLIYARHGTFEMFARAKSQRYFNRIKTLLRVKDRAELGDLLTKIEAEPERIPKWQYEGISPRRLIQFDTIATVP